jgi:hypothetical protein
MTERLDGGRILVAVGAVALLVSLFLDWYGPGELGFGTAITAWTAFEITDLLLALIAVGALLVAVGATVPEARLPEAPGAAPPILGAAAFVLVAISLIDVPPAANGASLETGAWIALAGSALMLIGGVLSVTRVRLVVTVSPREQAPPDPMEEEGEPVAYGDEAIGAEETQPLQVEDDER